MLVDQEQDEGKAENAHDASACSHSSSRDACKGRETAKEGEAPFPLFLLKGN